MSNEIRNILDAQGNVIGTLGLPENTPESVWQEKLAAYSEKDIPAITPRQLRLELFSIGITNAAVVAAIESAVDEPDQTIALIEWEYAISFDRKSPFVDAVGLVLGLSPEQVDELWLAASKRI